MLQDRHSQKRTSSNQLLQPTWLAKAKWSSRMDEMRQIKRVRPTTGVCLSASPGQVFPQANLEIVAAR